MKAVRFHGVADLRIDDLPEPEPAAGEVLLAPAAVGVCGTDTHILDGHYPARPPVTLGHEVGARVIELGRGVTGLSVGDLVTVEPHKYCGVCPYCRLGMEHMCVNKQTYGVYLDGGMAERMVVPARVAYRLPPHITPTAAALTEPLACCVHGMDRLAPRSGLPLLVMGAGPAGAILIALARLSGLHPIVAADTRAGRRDLAARMGADIVLDPAEEDFDAHAQEATDGLGFPYLTDTVGSPAVVETCVRLASRGATILVFGVAAPEAQARVRPNEIYTKELTLLGTASNPFTHLRATGLLTRLPLHELHVATYPLDKAREAIEAARQGAVDKVQIIPVAS